MPPKTSKKRPLGPETEPRRKSARLNTAPATPATVPSTNDPILANNNTTMPSNDNHREIHVVVSGDDIAEIINKMARRSIRGIDRDHNYERVITTFQERALEALEDLYTRIDGRAEWAKTRNRGSFVGVDDEEEEEEEDEAKGAPVVVDVDKDDEHLGEEGERYCLCWREGFGRMYGCEGKECPYMWFHESCIVKLMKKDHQPVEDEDWTCPVCVEKEKRNQLDRATAGRLWPRNPNLPI